jgi:uncharacterized RDD family membrane protein YckC
MTTQWWYAQDGSAHGPVPREALQALWRAQRIDGATLVWRGGLTHWQPLAELAEFAELAERTQGLPPPLPAPPRVPAGPSSGPAAHEPHLPGFGGFTGPAPAALPEVPGAVRRATLWQRFVARAVDINVFALWVGLLWLWVGPRDAWYAAAASGGGTAAAFLLLPLALAAEALVLAWAGTSPGKALVGLRVQRIDGAALTTSDALRRAFGVWTAALACGVPLVSLATMLWQATRVGRGDPASYDVGRFVVHSRGRAWRTALVGGGTAAAFLLLPLALAAGH